jgi:hypothetical protein
MKIRTGFVSNSSSSSFIVAYKGEKPSVEQVMESFGIAKGSPAAVMFGGIFETLLAAKPMPKADIEYLREDRSDDEVLKLLDDGWTVLRGSSSDEGRDPSDAFLCFSDIDVSTKTLKITKSAGY